MLAYAFHPTLNGAWTDPFLFYVKEGLLYISTQRIWELAPISIMVATSVRNISHKHSDYCVLDELHHYRV